MRSIIISVEEFLANGGKLEVGRTLYKHTELVFTEGDQRNSIVLAMQEWGTYIGWDDNQKVYLVKNSSFRSMPVSTSLTFVKVKITPSYE